MIRAFRTRTRNKRLIILICGFSILLLLIFVFHAFSSNNTHNNDQAIETINKEPPTILFWTTVFNEAPNLKDPCPVNCTLTTDRDLLRNASAVVFHAHDINKERRLPTPTSSKQKFVFMSQEAAPSLDKESKGKWWKSVINFHWIIGYMTKAHIKMPYGGVFVDPATGRARKFQPIGKFNKEQVLLSKSIKGAAWLVSNCESKERMNVALALKQHFHVDIGGKCSPDNKDLCPHGRDCNPLISQYYFYLAFENENCVDYVTEKMVDLLSLPVVPIVMKRNVYQNIFPPEAFVAVDDFPSAQKLAEHLQFLIDNPDEYFKLIVWRNEWTRAGWNSDGYLLGLCALCKKLHQERDSIVQPISDLKQWYEETSKCEKAVSPSWFN